MSRKVYDKLTGDEIVEGEAQHAHINKMCLNCSFLCENDDDENYRCCNEAVMNTGKKKIFESLPDGFEIENLELKPMILKNPTKKCNNYNPDTETITNIILCELL